MRGDVVYRVYGRHEGREKDAYFGAFRTVSLADAETVRLSSGMYGQNWAEQYHNRGFVVREAVVESDFEIPPCPKPRDRYYVQETSVESGANTIAGTLVEVFRRADGGGEPTKVGEYKRDYDLLQTFEPFRQGGREFALISPQYTRTSVLDLATGRVIAAEPDSSSGFCPVGFYVPDWWDLHEGSIIPGSEYWDADFEWPSGEIGFVWGCCWGDDSSWKVQLLDLTRIQSGIILREERFGYVELAIDGYQSPCIEPEVAAPPRDAAPPPFIQIRRRKGKTNVTFAVEMEFDLASGKSAEWQRQQIANLE